MPHPLFHRLYRQIVSFGLCLLLTLSLGACGSSPQQVEDRPIQQVTVQPGDGQTVHRPEDSQEEQQAAADPNGQENDSAPSPYTEGTFFSIHIRINPELELHVDEQGVVITLLPLNEDGHAICDTSQVVGMIYTDALPVIMEQADQQGYLTSATQIEVQFDFVEASLQTMDIYHQAAMESIAQYTSQHNLEHLQFGGGYGAMVVLENEDPQWQPQQQPSNPGQNTNAPTPNENLLEQKTDEDGNLIYAKYKCSGGGYTEHYYRADGAFLKQILHESNGSVCTMLYDDQGILTQEIIEEADGIKCTRQIRPNGTVREEMIHHTDGSQILILFDEQGRLSQEHREAPDGYQETSWFGPDGMILRFENHQPDGTTCQMTYHPDGKIASNHEVFPDGNWAQHTYSEDGLSCHSEYSDGREEQRTLHANGQTAVLRSRYAGGSLEEHYDENGNLTLAISVDASGKKAETRFNADRSGSMTQYGADGSSSTVYFRPDGKVTHGYDSNGNYYEETRDVYAGTKNGGKG